MCFGSIMAHTGSVVMNPVLSRNAASIVLIFPGRAFSLFLGNTTEHGIRSSGILPADYLRQSAPRPRSGAEAFPEFSASGTSKKLADELAALVERAHQNRDVLGNQFGRSALKEGQR